MSGVAGVRRAQFVWFDFDDVVEYTQSETRPTEAEAGMEGEKT